MNDELIDLFDLRWKERDKLLIQAFLGVNQEMSGRGMLISSETIKKYHKVLLAEFELNRNLISKTIIDVFQKKHSSIDRKKTEIYAQKIFRDRKDKLELMLKSKAENILSGLLNSAMTAPFTNLDDAFPLAQKELSIELSSAMGVYEKSLGNTLAERIRNRFMNNPILVVVVLSITGATFIVAFLKLLGLI